jgi:hypothetical protein
MATTTNYGWDTPDDTDLVKDGAAAIRTLGSSVDTTTKALNPSTTEGDIEYRSATANTNTRLAIGTAGQVLTVNSGADAPEWATSSSGGMTLLSTTTLSGATVTISSIDQTYKSLVMFIYGVTNATADGEFICKINTSNTASFTRPNTNSTFTFPSGSFITLSSINASYLPKRTSNLNGWKFQIDNYSSSTSFKPIQISGAYRAVDAYGDDMWVNNLGGINTTSAVTQLIFSNAGGNLSTGTVELYGVK